MNPNFPSVDLPPERAANIPASEFSRMIREMSEDGGFFSSDAFTSNETGYLHVLGELRRLGISGGAYLGVGPETNFTYIARIRPEIAFVVDIRRAAMIHHLMYKAIFHRARDRAEFLALLFSKPLPPGRTEASGSLVALVDYIEFAPTTRERFADNLAIIRSTIEDTFQMPLSSTDAESLERIYESFWRANLSIGYAGGFASLKDLILETDLDGKRGNFLVEEADYGFVRDLQEQNRVIPLVGDFAGFKALAGVANYLEQHHHTVSAFYTSNVEEYLFQDRTFAKFADNVARFASSDGAVFIRSLRAGWAERHPANPRRFSRTSQLAGIANFLKDYREGACSNYWKLITAHCIRGTESA
jgi:hypothetical protein